MKKIITTLKAIAVVAVAIASFEVTSPPAEAADYDIQKTFWRVTDFTNNPATATNLASTIDLSMYGDFYLEFIVNLTNASAGTLSVAYDTYASTTAPSGIPAGQGMNPVAGWWSVPLSNNQTRVVWGTNITAGSAAYWRLNWLTNLSVQHITNITVRGYVKPKRYGP